MNRLIFLLAILMICFALEGVVELTDSNFKELLQSQPKLWFVVFSASWCGQCTDLKPQLEKVAPLLAELGVTVGHVGQHNQDLIIDFVLDPKTHLLSYPKLMVFNGGKKMSDVPIWLRSAPQILDWFKDTYNLMASNQL